MALSTISETWRGRAGGDNTDEGTYVRAFLCTTDDKLDNADVIITSGLEAGKGIYIGTQFPDDTRARCVSRTCTQLDSSPTVWNVTVEYSTRPNVAIDPTEQAARISWSTEQFQKVAHKDINGDAIVNSAGDWFDPPPMIDHSRIVANITKHIGYVPPWILTAEDMVNSDVFVIDGITVGPKTGKIQRITLSDVKWWGSRQIPYRTLNMSIHFNTTPGYGWMLQVLDAGFREKINNKMKQITNDDDDIEPSTPVPLDGNGRVLANPSPDTAVFGSWDVYNTQSYAALSWVWN